MSHLYKIRKLFSLWLILPLALISACSENSKSIYREFEIVPEKGASVITDAKQRVITNVDIVNDSISGQVLPKRIVCAEPSPDVAQGISEAITASLTVPETDGESSPTSAGFGYQSVAAVAQLGERLATIQLLWAIDIAKHTRTVQ